MLVMRSQWPGSLSIRADHVGSRPAMLCQGSPWHLPNLPPGQEQVPPEGHHVLLQILRSPRDVMGLCKHVRLTCYLEARIPGICFMEKAHLVLSYSQLLSSQYR